MRPALRENNLLQIDLFTPLLFLYFFTLHADQLAFQLGGYTVRINNLIALLLLGLVCLRFRARLFSIERQLVLALLGMTCALLLSFLFSSYQQRCLLFIGWYGWVILCYFLLPYLCMQLAESDKLFSLYLASFVLVGIYALVQLLLSLFGVNDPFAQQRIMGAIIRPNAFAYEPSFYALYMTPCIMLCNFHFIVTPEEPFFCLKKLTPTKISFLNALYLISTSTSTLFAYALFFGMMLLFSWSKQSRKRCVKFILSFSFSGLLLFAIAPFLIRNFYMKFFFSGFMAHHSFYERWVGIKNAWHIFLEKPFLGVGLGGYPSHLYQAWQSGDQSYLFFEHHFDPSLANFLKFFEPTNAFTELLASLGLVGAFFFCYFIALFFLKARYCFSQNYRGGLGSNLLVSSIVLLSTLQLNQGLFRTYVWVHLAMAYATLTLLNKSIDQLRQKPLKALSAHP